MEYREYGGVFYIRMDRGDEIVAGILDVCRREGVRSATFSGIGGCDKATILVFSPENGGFHAEQAEGILELVSLNGNVIAGDDGALHHHAHALFAYREDGEPRIAAGHLDETTVLYTAEIELRPVAGGTIGAELNEETGTCFWKFA